MGQYCYLINKENRIRVEGYKLSSSGEESLQIENTDNLLRFLEYCKENELSIQCVNEHYFIDVNENYEKPFTDFEELTLNN